MNISDLFSGEKAEQFKTIEGNLLRRKRNGKIAGTLAMLTAVGQALILLWPVLKEILVGGGVVDLTYFVNLPNYVLLLLVAIFLFIYFIFRRTSFLLNETKEPFRYTFYVEEFQKIESVNNGFNLKNVDRLKMLHHDLIELINKRIKRFSILKDQHLTDNPDKKVTDPRKSSHVRIYGNYAVREDKENGDWIIHVMPYIQVGSSDAPATLAQSVRFSLTTDETPDVFDTQEYNQLLERVYSRVTTEIYARIKQDIDNKIKLFPTSYLQENALFQEALDMAASNTINAFDSAIGLYEMAMRKSESSIRIQLFTALFKMQPLRSWLIRFLHHYARIRIGHSLCLVYKKRIASLSGRSSNPIFEIRLNLKRVIALLELVIFRIGRNRESREFSDDQKTFFNLSYLSYPPDSFVRTLFFRAPKKLFDETREILFNAYVVHALSDTLLNSFIEAREKLDKARSLSPDLSRESVLFLLAEGYVEPDIDKAIFLFRQASEKDPSFQIAQYDLAFWSEMKFRKEGASDKDRAFMVLDEYDKVLKINPGNIAALAAQGYILWILKELNKARRKFEEGIEIKAIVSETFVGILWYGLARVYAEKGFITKSYDFYRQAIISSPNLGAYFMYDNSNVNISFYEYITPGLLKRYEEFNAGYRFFEGNNVNHLLQVHDDDRGEWQSALQNMKVDEISTLLHHTGLFTGPIEFVETGDSNRWKVTAKSDDLMPEAKVEEFILELAGDNLVISQKGSKQLFTRLGSFVLNDIGNASLNYFRRYGDKNQLNKSVLLFEEAIRLNPENIIAKYNKSLALLYQKPLLKQIELEDIDSDYIREVLEISGEVIENYPNWMEGLVSYFEILKRTRQDLVREQREYKTRIENYKAQQVESQFLFPTSKGGNLFASGGVLEGSVSQQEIRKSQPVSETETDIRVSPELSLEELKSREGQCVTMMDVIDEKIEVVVWKAIESTSYDPLYAGLKLGDFSQESIRDLLGKKIQWVRLNEMDARSLKLYATAYQYFKSERMQEEYDTINSLFNHLLNYYYPEDFDIFLLRRDLLDSVVDSPEYQDEVYQLVKSCNNLSEQLVSELERKQLPADVGNLLYRLGLPVDKEHDCEVETSEDGNCTFAINCKDRYDLKRRHFRIETRGKTTLLYESMIDHCNIVLKSFTLFSLAQDKINFEFLNYYARNYLSLEAYLGCLKQALNSHFNLDVLDLLAQDEKEADELTKFVALAEAVNLSQENRQTLARIQNRAGILLYDESRVEQAIPYYNKAIELDKEKPIYQNNLGLMYTKLENPEYEEACRFYKMAIDTRKNALGDDYSFGFYFEGWTEALYHTDTLDLLENEIANSSDLLHDQLPVAQLFNRVGNLYYHDGKPNEAIPYYEKAISVYADWPIFYANLGLMYITVDPPQYELAIQYYQDAIQLRKQVVDEDYDLAYFYEYLAETMFKSETIDAFKYQVESEDPEWLSDAAKANIFNMVGNLYFNGDQPDEAIEFYREAISHNPEKPIFYANLGLMYSNLKPPKFDEALDQYRKAVAVRKSREQDEFGMNYYFEYLADISFKSQRMDEFLSQLEQEDSEVLSREEKASVCNQIGNLYFRANAFDDAGRWYDKAIGLFTTRPIYWANRGLVFRSLKEPNNEEAYQFYEKAVQLRRQNREDEYSLVYYLGYFADSAQKIGKLREFFNEFEANAINNSDPVELANFYNLLGNLLYRDAKPQEAIPYYSRAIELQTERPVFYSNLGLMYAELRRPNYGEALKNYEKAYEIRQRLESDVYDLDYYKNGIDEVKSKMAQSS